MNDTAEFRLGYRPALDGVRAIAIVMVMWHHTIAVMLRRVDLPLGGFLGVDLFFVLSGFLITSLLIERRTPDGGIGYANFYKRRAQRLLPALFALLAVNVVVMQRLGHNMKLEAKSVAFAVTYLTNWSHVFNVKLAPDLPHLWSLAIEEQFYFVWPVVVALLLARRPRTMLIVLGVGIVGVMAWRVVLTHHYGNPYPIVYQRTDTRADGLLLGALLAAAMHVGWRPPARARMIAGVGGLAVLGWLFATVDVKPMFLYRGGFTLVALAGGGIVLAALDGPGPLHRVLSWGPAVKLGRISYSLYLWHVLVFILTAAVLSGSNWVRVPIAWVGAVAVAWLSHKFIEQPFLARGSAERDDRGAAPAASADRRWPLALGSAAAALLTLAGVGTALASIGR
jgi:peptidoglycan/LPS O-acetylase OafA/YrhL